MPPHREGRVYAPIATEIFTEHGSGTLKGVEA